MRGGRTVGVLLAVGGLMLCAAPVAAASELPKAPQLLAGISRLNDELALMGQGSSAVGPPRKSALSELRFVNRDGYTISVVAFEQTVALSVTRARVRPHQGGDGHRKRRTRLATTTYLAHGKVTPTSIEASFGDRGRIAVRFRPSGRDVHATRKAGCKDPSDAILAHLGVFVGALRFEGEGGYTSVEARRVSGRSVDLSALVACLLGRGPGRHAAIPPPRAPLGLHLPGLVAADGTRAASAPGVATHPSTGPKSTTLFAESKLALQRVVFAAQVRDAGRAHFLAVDEVSEGSIGILRLVYARGASSGLTFDATLSRGSASPPPPFSGRGILEHGPRDAKSWTGSLAVSFLGAPRVSLTGSPFDALLVRGW